MHSTWVGAAWPSHRPVPALAIPVRSSTGTRMAPQWSSLLPAGQKQTPAFCQSSGFQLLQRTAWGKVLVSEETRTTKQKATFVEEPRCEGVLSGAARGLQQGPQPAEPMADHYPSSSAAYSCSFSVPCSRANAPLGISSLMIDGLRLSHEGLLQPSALARGTIFSRQERNRGRAFS